MEKLEALKLLNLAGSPSDEAINRAFRKKALTCHPDRFPNDASKEADFKQVGEARDTLIKANSVDNTDDISNDTDSSLNEIYVNAMNMLNTIEKTFRSTDLNVLQHIFNENNVNAPYQLPVTPLALAVQYSNPVLVELLIKLGADINLNLGGATTLERAFMAKNIHILDLLTKTGIDIPQKGENIGTLLPFACEMGNLKLVDKLISISKNKADMMAYVNATSYYDKTPALQKAAMNGHYEIVDYLIKSGSNPFDTTKKIQLELAKLECFSLVGKLYLSNPEPVQCRIEAKNIYDSFNKNNCLSRAPNSLDFDDLIDDIQYCTPDVIENIQTELNQNANALMLINTAKLKQDIIENITVLTQPFDKKTIDTSMLIQGLQNEILAATFEVNYKSLLSNINDENIEHSYDQTCLLYQQCGGISNPYLINAETIIETLESLVIDTPEERRINMRSLDLDSCSEDIKTGQDRLIQLENLLSNITNSALCQDSPSNADKHIKSMEPGSARRMSYDYISC